MKRQGDLFRRIIDIENVQLAYIKARKGKIGRKEVYSYGKNLHRNLKRLQRELTSGTISAGKYRIFTVYDPKKRQIYAAPFHQRVMHHALMNVCHQRFEKVQIFDSYASRPGKGTYAALDRAKIHCEKYIWFLKLDVCKYFDNIDHGILKEQLQKLFKDKCLLNIFDSIIDSYRVKEKRGVPIGNLTSQYFANHYLCCADHYIRENLRIPGYLRYMDDMVLWHYDKESLKKTGNLYRNYLEDTLHLQLKPLCLNRCAKGLTFLGYLIYPGKVLLSSRSRKRFFRKLRLYGKMVSSSQWSQKEYQNHVQPLVAYTEHADALGFRKKIIFEME